MIDYRNNPCTSSKVSKIMGEATDASAMNISVAYPRTGRVILNTAVTAATLLALTSAYSGAKAVATKWKARRAEKKNSAAAPEATSEEKSKE